MPDVLRISVRGMGEELRGGGETGFSEGDTFGRVWGGVQRRGAGGGGEEEGEGTL